MMEDLLLYSDDNIGIMNFIDLRGVVDTDQSQNYGTFGQTQTQQQYQIPQQTQQQSFNSFPQYGTGNGFDASTWAQANANLFQQQQNQQQANGYGIQPNNFGNQANVASYGQNYGQQQIPNQNYGQATVQTQNYGQSQIQNQNYGQSQFQNQNYGVGLPQQTVQTFYPFTSSEQQQVSQQVQQPFQQQTNQQPYQPAVDPFIQPYVAPEVAPQPQQATQYGNNFPQSSYPAPAPAPAQIVPEPEPVTAQPTIDLAQLQQYAQYLEQIQKQYGIKMPSTQSGVPAPQAHVEVQTPQNPYASAVQSQIQPHVEVHGQQNPYAAAVQPQTQTHIQGTINSGIQGSYSVPAGGSQGQNSFNAWQTGFNSNYNQQIQAPSRPMNQISPSDSVYQAPQPAPAPAPVQQPYFPDYSSSN
uniref:Uncharacterized protein n=1 Tax=Panagrolaimus sp. JU765 TaxID=591449 RepID=A0AC34RNN6_9BILA